MFSSQNFWQAVSRDYFVSEGPTPYQFALLSEHERLSALLSSLASLSRLPSGLSPQLQNNLKVLRSSEVVVSDPGVEGLYDQLTGIIDSKIGMPLEHADARKLSEIAEEIRVRMVAVSLVSGLGIDALSELLILDSGSPNPWQGTLVHGTGGVTYATLRGFTVILFSEVVSVAQCHEILAELSNIYDKTHLSNSWIFDFSAVTELPIVLLGSLLSYQKQLAAVDKDLLLCWAKPGMFPTEALDRFTRLFRLVEVGGHLFSRPRAPGSLLG